MLKICTSGSGLTFEETSDEKLEKVVEINLTLLRLLCSEENTVYFPLVKLFWSKQFVRSVNEIYHQSLKKNLKKEKTKKPYPNLALSHAGTEAQLFSE